MQAFASVLGRIMMNRVKPFALNTQDKSLPLHGSLPSLVRDENETPCQLAYAVKCHESSSHEQSFT